MVPCRASVAEDKISNKSSLPSSHVILCKISSVALVAFFPTFHSHRSCERKQICVRSWHWLSLQELQRRHSTRTNGILTRSRMDGTFEHWSPVFCIHDPGGRARKARSERTSRRLQCVYTDDYPTLLLKIQWAHDLFTSIQSHSRYCRDVKAAKVMEAKLVFTSRITNR